MFQSFVTSFYQVKNVSFKVSKSFLLNDEWILIILNVFFASTWDNHNFSSKSLLLILVCPLTIQLLISTIVYDSKYFIIKKTGGVTFQSSLSQSSIYDMELQANLNCSKNFVDSLQLEWVAMEWCFS